MNMNNNQNSKLKQIKNQWHDNNLAIIKQVIQKNKSILGKFVNNQSQTNKIQDEQQMLQKQNWVDSIQKLQGGGVINDIYKICDKYILKIESYITDITVHQVQLFQLANQNKIKVPALIDYGQFYNKRYMLMTKVFGDRLWRHWLTLTEQQKQYCMSYICQEIKKLHNIVFDTFSPRRPWQFETLYQAFHYYSNDYFKNFSDNKEKISKLDELTLKNYNFIVQYSKQNMHILKQKLYDDEKPVFIHNDLHFGNILYDENQHKVTGILDFDFSRQLTKDYELWRIIDVFFRPWRYAEDEFEEKWKGYEIKNEIKYIKKYYPQLFNCQKESLCARLRLYLTQSLVDNLQGGHFQYFNQKVQAYFKSKWLQVLLS